jgi:tetratricopeptide (TPR) repeat protein
MKAYTQVVALDPAYLSGQVRLGDLYRRRGDLETAADLYARARELDPVHTTVIERQLRVFQALDRTEEARRSAQQLLAIEPDNREALDLLGGATTDQGED